MHGRLQGLSPAGTGDRGERLDLVDALRGFALFGILFVNATWFSGTAVLGDADRQSLQTPELDAWVRWATHVFVEAKFYSLFALLFGVCFGLRWRPGDDPTTARRRHHRRMLVLLGIGGLHASLLWFGDIVSLYAVTGLLLPWFARCRPRTLLAWSVGLLLAPVVWSAIRSALSDAGAAVDPEHGPVALLDAFATGSVLEVLAANLAFLRERWILAVDSGRFFKLLGLFVLGLWCVRAGLVGRPEAHRRTLWRTLWIGAAVGLPANLGLASFPADTPEAGPSLLGCARAVASVAAAPSLALAYASALTLAWTGERAGRGVVQGALAAAGRMSFSNYLSQTLVGIALGYGIGLGLWGRCGEAAVAAALPVLFGLQVGLSALWLGRWRRGPVEWLVRRVAP